MRCLWKCCCKGGLKVYCRRWLLCDVVVARDVGMSVVDGGAGGRGSEVVETLVNQCVGRSVKILKA